MSTYFKTIKLWWWRHWTKEKIDWAALPRCPLLLDFVHLGCFMVAITSPPTLKWCSVVIENIQILGGKWVYCARKSTPFKSTATFIQTCIKLYYCQMPDQEAALQLVQARCFAYAKFLGNHPGLTPLKTEGKNHESDFELRKPPSGEWRHSQSIRKRLTNWLVINTSQS